MNRRSLLLAAILALAVSACTNPFASPGTVYVRVENATAYTLQDVVVGFPSGTERYGSLAAGERSAFRRVGRAYGYAYVEVRVEGRTLVQQPIDYVGESLLEPGRYTYVLDITALDDAYGVRSQLRVE
jgi:hypothetical protein